VRRRKMPQIKTEFCCPICERATGKHVQIVASEGKLQCPENSTHRWIDTPSFYADGPKMVFKVGPAKFPPVEGQTPITLKIPLRIKTELEKRWGAEEAVSAKVSDVLLQLVDGDVMVLGQTDMNRLFERLGEKFSNSSELVGVVYAKMCEVDEARGERDSAIEDLKAYESRSPGRVVIDLGSQYQTAAEKAKDAEQPLKIWLEQQLVNGLQNSWF
jgi:hypothetical protein